MQPLEIAYLAHDPGDPALARRVAMLRAAGADASLARFYRSDLVPMEAAGAVPLSLGRREEARLGHRALQVACAALLQVQQLRRH